VKPSQAAAALELYVAANQPAFVHGSPGGGKSAIAHQLAEKLRWPLIDMRLSQLESHAGLPTANCQTSADTAQTVSCSWTR
jgi:MoxR-like ATPase